MSASIKAQLWLGRMMLMQYLKNLENQGRVFYETAKFQTAWVYWGKATGRAGRQKIYTHYRHKASKCHGLYHVYSYHWPISLQNLTPVWGAHTLTTSMVSFVHSRRGIHKAWSRRVCMNEDHIPCSWLFQSTTELRRRGGEAKDCGIRTMVDAAWRAPKLMRDDIKWATKVTNG